MSENADILPRRVISGKIGAMALKTLYLIRHATPDWTRKDIPYHLPPGPPLTPLGLAEAQALGAFLRQAGVWKLYSSPMERAFHTAQIAAGIARAHLFVDEHLMEWQPGDTTDGVWSKLAGLVKQASMEAEQAPVGLVTHGAPVGAILHGLGMPFATLVSNRKFDHNNPLPTAGAWMAQQEQPDGPWRLELAFIPQVQPLPTMI
jgi:phosphohistidine phosphatase SixA